MLPPSSATAHKIHPISPYWRTSYCVGASLWIIIAAWHAIQTIWAINYGPLLRVGYGLLVILEISTVVVWFRRAFQTRLSTSAQGLVYYGIGFSLHTPWDNIEKIGRLSFWRGSGEALRLRQSPLIQGSQWGAWLWHEKNTIPLFEFGRWEVSALGEEIKHYAPRLLTR